MQANRVTGGVSTAGGRAEDAALPGAGDQQPTWEGGQFAGDGTGLALGPVPLLQLALQGVELAVAAVDEVLGSSFGLHLNDENLGRPEVRGSGFGGQRQREGEVWRSQGFLASV